MGVPRGRTAGAVIGLFVAAMLLLPGTSGLTVYEDGFELLVNPVFWDRVAGDVGRTDDRSFSGDWSLVSDPEVFPRGGLQHSGEVGLGPVGFVSVWMYDDAGANKHQVLGIGDDDAYPRGTAILGIRATVSQDSYVCRSGLQYLATDIERSEGWHHLRLEWDSSGVRYSIDDVAVETCVQDDVAVDGPDKVTLGDVWVGTGSGPAWFDDFAVGTPLALDGFGTETMEDADIADTSGVGTGHAR